MSCYGGKEAWRLWLGPEYPSNNFQCCPCLVIASLKPSKATRILQTQPSVSPFAWVPCAASLNSACWIVWLKYYHVFVIIVTTCLPSLKKDPWIQVHIFCISFKAPWSNLILFVWWMMLFPPGSEIHWSLAIVLYPQSCVPMLIEFCHISGHVTSPADYHTRYTENFLSTWELQVASSNRLC